MCVPVNRFARSKRLRPMVRETWPTKPCLHPVRFSLQRMAKLLLSQECMSSHTILRVGGNYSPGITRDPSNPQTQLFIGGRALEFPALRMLALSPDGTMAAGLAPFPDAPNKRIVLCDARNGKIIHTCDNSSGSAIATLSPIGYVNASFSDNGHLLVSSHGNSLDLWETATGAKLALPRDIRPRSFHLALTA